MSKNPWLNIAYPLDWTALSLDTLPAALEEGLSLAKERLAALEALPLKSASVENFLKPMEILSDELDHAWGLANHISSVQDSPAIRELVQKYLPILTEFYTTIGLSSALYERVAHVAQTREGKALKGAFKRALELTHKSFKRSGAALKPAAKAALLELNKELSTLEDKFENTVLDATNAYEKYFEEGAEKTALLGLPETALAMARGSAKSKGKTGYRFTLHQPSLVSILTYAESASLRRELWEASTFKCHREEFNTLPLIQKILTLRQQKAKLLGYRSFAHLATEERMLNSPAKILSFLKKLHRRTRKPSLKEFSRLTALKKTLGDAVPFNPWDRAYYGEILMEKELGLNTEALRPYFSFEVVRKSIFDLAGRLFGVSFKKVEGHKAWHDSVEYFEISDTATGRLIGGFYTDFFPRAEKRGGAWMNGLHTGRADAEGQPLSPHIGFIGGNFTPPAEGQPSLLTHDEVKTFYHEFGHLLHQLLTEVPVPGLAGTSVPRDFVEVPSQFLENYCYAPEYLPTIARHYQTGEVISTELIEKLSHERKFLAGILAERQLTFALSDMVMHTQPAEKITPQLETFIEKLLSDYRLPYSVQPPATPLRSFTHLFGGGYAAGYYSYKWSEVQEADLWAMFKKKGILSAEVGLAYRSKILARGNAQPSLELFKSLMGRAPKLDAYLERAGLK